MLEMIHKKGIDLEPLMIMKLIEINDGREKFYVEEIEIYKVGLEEYKHIKKNE